MELARATSEPSSGSEAFRAAAMASRSWPSSRLPIAFSRKSTRLRRVSVCKNFCASSTSCTGTSACGSVGKMRFNMLRGYTGSQACLAGIAYRTPQLYLIPSLHSITPSDINKRVERRTIP